MAILILLGGPPGVGKSSVCRRLVDMGWCHVEADDIVPPDSEITRSDAIANVASQTKTVLSQHAVVVLSWVFARSILYQPFLDEFTSTNDVRLLYLVCTEEQLDARLSSRSSTDLQMYAVSRLRLINDLTFEKIDTTSMDLNEIASRIFERFTIAT